MKTTSKPRRHARPRQAPLSYAVYQDETGMFYVAHHTRELCRVADSTGAKGRAIQIAARMNGLTMTELVKDRRFKIHLYHPARIKEYTGFTDTIQ